MTARTPVRANSTTTLAPPGIGSVCVSPGTRSTLRPPHRPSALRQAAIPTSLTVSMPSPMVAWSRSTRLSGVPRPARTPRCAQSGGQRIDKIRCVARPPSRRHGAAGRSPFVWSTDGHEPAAHCRRQPSWAIQCRVVRGQNVHKIVIVDPSAATSTALTCCFGCSGEGIRNPATTLREPTRHGLSRETRPRPDLDVSPYRNQHVVVRGDRFDNGVGECRLARGVDVDGTFGQAAPADTDGTEPALQRQTPIPGVTHDPPREKKGRSLAHGQSCAHRREPSLQREAECRRPRRNTPTRSLLQPDHAFPT